MRKLSAIFGFLILGLVTTQAQITIKGADTPVKVQWMNLEKALELSEQQPRKIIVDVYTSWCRWCDKMEEITFSNPKIAQYINENFYPVKFDAEGKEEIQYKDKTYGFSKSGKREYHDLAKELMGGRFSFPTVIFLDENQNLIQCVVGFKTPTQFEQISSYFADDHYRRIPWSSFLESFQHQAEKE